ncbi:hypothetical protein MLD55_08380 [Alcanivorax sp. MM125-6]|nr:hypothetical protein [Alcanivorax sp. MM125-6]
MSIACTKDLHLHIKTLIAATDRGEEVIITWPRRPRAKLVPLAWHEVLEAPAPGLDRRNPAFGLWREREEGESVDQQVRRLRRPEPLPDNLSCCDSFFFYWSNNPLNSLKNFESGLVSGGAWRHTARVFDDW